MNQNNKIALFILSAGILIWFFFLQNLPFTFGDDLNVIEYARNHSWSELIRSFLNPLTPALYVHGMESLGTTRALEPLLFKILFSLFGYQPNAFWMIKIIGVSVTSAFIYLLLQRTTGRIWLSLFASVLFLFASPMYRGIAWIADLEIIAQMGTVVAVFLFLKIYFSDEDSKDNLAKWILYFVLMIASYWIGMKVKETGRLFPFISLGFIILDQNFKFLKWIASSKKNIVLLISIILLIFTVIPLGAPDASVLDERAKHATSNLNIENLLNIIWMNPLSRHIPADLGSTFGWILYLLIPVGFIIVIIRLIQSRQYGTPHRMTLYFFIWFMLALAGTTFGFNLENNERYLTVVLVPATLLFFSILGLLLMNQPKKIFIVSYLILLGLMGYSVQKNFSYMIFMRNYYDSTNIVDWKATQIIYKDRYGKEPSWQNLDDFYRGKPPYSAAEFHEIRFKEWDRSVPSDIKSLSPVAQKWNAAYVMSYDEGLYKNEPNAKLLMKSDTKNGSVYSAVMPKIKKKALKQFYVYKISFVTPAKAGVHFNENGLEKS